MFDFNNATGLYTDYYELTMAQGYFMNNRKNVSAGFDYFFRKMPFNGGYVIFSGLYDVLQQLKEFRYTSDDCQYLLSAGFNEKFVEYLNDFHFNAEVYACREGEIVFPNEPVLRVRGNIIESQIVETIILNMLNFQSLIATKASRIRQVAGERLFIDFGLRRAQGFGGLHASKAAVAGGADSTSNVYTARHFGIKASGTQAHSWIQSYDNELDAFRAFANNFPENTILLVDTYNTLKSGIPNAIKVAKEMEQKGNKLKGIRLDSGDLAYLSKKARKMLNEAGLYYVKITVSNQLDEYVIKSLIDQGAPIDAFGVGTRLITAKDDPALDGVYKLSMSNDLPQMKFSENVEKMSLPGLKKVFRYYDEHDLFYADGILLEDEVETGRIYHPYQTDKSLDVQGLKKEGLMYKVMSENQILTENHSTAEIKEFIKERLAKLPDEHKRFENPHLYKVGISKKLLELRKQKIRKIKNMNHLN